LTVPVISPSVAVDFLDPFLAIRGRDLEKRTIVSMPEASIRLDDGTVARQHDVGSTGEFLSMKAKSETLAMKAAAEQHFQPGVLSLDAGHHPASGFLGNDVSHAPSPRRRNSSCEFYCRRGKG
jgi:hypothetical protein